MVSTKRKTEEHVELLVETTGPPKETTWRALVKQNLKERMLKSRTCKIY